MSDDRLSVAGSLLTLAAELRDRGGIVRRAARMLMEAPATSGPGRCEHCGRQLGGRQRRWCSEPCRRRHRP